MTSFNIVTVVLLSLLSLCPVLAQEKDDTTTRRSLIKPWSRLPIGDIVTDAPEEDYPLIPVPCTLANNTLGTCECQSQFFAAEECHHGFYCLNKNQFPGYDGCEIMCQPDQVLVVDPRNSGSWSCKTVTDNSAVLGGVCPGKFNTECGCDDGSNPDCEIGECACDGQLWVNHDCKTARYCDSSLNDDGYSETTCQGDQIVYVNLIDNSWSCDVDDGRCPGSFHVGCREDEYTTQPAETTEDPNNGSESSLANLAMMLATLGFALFV